MKKRKVTLDQKLVLDKEVINQLLTAEKTMVVGGQTVYPQCVTVVNTCAAGCYTQADPPESRCVFC